MRAFRNVFFGIDGALDAADAIGDALLHLRQLFGREAEGAERLAHQHAKRIERLLFFGHRGLFLRLGFGRIRGANGEGQGAEQRRKGS